MDQLIVGGGIANTFIAAEGHNVGKSLYEEDLVETAKNLKAAAQANGGDIPVPVDVVCAKEFSETAEERHQRQQQCWRYECAQRCLRWG